MPKSVWIEGKVIHTTTLSILFDYGGEKRAWFPRSEILDYSEEAYQEGDTIEIEIPDWLALQKDMI